MHVQYDDVKRGGNGPGGLLGGYPVQSTTPGVTRGGVTVRVNDQSRHIPYDNVKRDGMVLEGYCEGILYRLLRPGFLGGGLL